MIRNEFSKPQDSLHFQLFLSYAAATLDPGGPADRSVGLIGYTSTYLSVNISYQSLKCNPLYLQTSSPISNP